MADLTVNTPPSEEEDVFACFEGKRDGVQKRFLGQIWERFKEMSPAFVLLEFFGDQDRQLPVLWKHLQEDIPALVSVTESEGLRILQGDHRVITTSLLEEIADPLGITYEQGFGQVLPEQKEKWFRKAEVGRFCLVAGADGENSGFGEDDHLEMYLIVQALRLLR